MSATSPGCGRRYYEIEWQGRERTYYEIRWQDYRIWGATAAMIVNLSRRLELVP